MKRAVFHGHGGMWRRWMHAIEGLCACCWRLERPRFLQSAILQEAYRSGDGKAHCVQRIFKNYFGHLTRAQLQIDLYEIPKQDTWAFAMHHIITVALVLYSLFSGYVRIGSVLMYFFDWPDVLLTSAKTCKYLSLQRQDGYQFCADRLFEAFAAVFVLTRNVAFPHIVYICLLDTSTTATRSTDLTVMLTLLVLLVGLMFYWLAIIVKTAHHQMFGDGSVDDRSA